jgi:Fe-S-cluster-containing dehydrogenase component
MGDISRRGFLTAVAAGAVTATLTTTGSAQAAPRLDGFPDGMGVLVDLTRCVGCRTCEAACNKVNNMPAPDRPFDDRSVFDRSGHEGRQRRPDERAYTVVNRYDIPGSSPVYRKLQCNHCNEPSCLTSCFVNAYSKTPEGAVVYNPKVCVGCRMCMTACPFYAPGYSYSSATNPLIVKCNFCHEKRLKNGSPPACIEACPQEAMQFGRRKDLIAIGRERIRYTPGKYVNHIYGETEVGGTAWMYLSSVPFDQVGFDTTLQKEPIISNVKSFLGMVPMVLAIWPALFTGIHLLSKKREDAMAGHGDKKEGGS